jgi:hypothetical protein
MRFWSGARHTQPNSSSGMPSALVHRRSEKSGVLRSSPLRRERITRILSLTDVGSVCLGPWEVWAVLDHVGVPVSDFERSKRFYAQALSPLGYELIMEPTDSAAGFGRRGKPDFWIAQGEPGQAFHIAFAADDRATVDAFYEALTGIIPGGRRPSRSLHTLMTTFPRACPSCRYRMASGTSASE